FENHCYLRIALDNTLQTKWDTVIKKPAYKHLTAAQLKQVVQLLESYDGNELLLKRDNTISLNYRKK
ncbi:MAG: acetyltransferase, partial [Bacteroidota bacterium]